MKKLRREALPDGGGITPEFFTGCVLMGPVLHQFAAVHHQVGAGDVAGVVGAGEQHDFRHLFGPCRIGDGPGGQRRFRVDRAKVLAVAVQSILEHLGLDDARGDRVNADVVAAELLGCDFGHADHGPLAAADRGGAADDRLALEHEGLEPEARRFGRGGKIRNR